MADERIRFTTELDTKPAIEEAKKLASKIDKAAQQSSSNPIIQKSIDLLKAQTKERWRQNLLIRTQESYEKSIAKINAEKAALADKIADREDKIAALKVAQQDADKYKTLAEGRYHGREKEPAAIKNQANLANAQANVTRIQGEIASIDREIEPMVREIADAEAEIRSMEARSRQFVSTWSESGTIAGNIESALRGDANAVAELDSRMNQTTASTDKFEAKTEETGENASVALGNIASVLHQVAEGAESAGASVKGSMEGIGSVGVLDLNVDPAKMSTLELIQFVRKARQEMRDLERGDSATEAQSNRYDQLSAKLKEAQEQLNAVNNAEKQTNNLDMSKLLNSINAFAKGTFNAQNGLQAIQVAVNTLGPAVQMLGLISETALAEATAGISLIITVLTELLTAIDRVKERISNAINSVIAFVKNLLSTVKKVISDIAKAIKELLSLVKRLADQIKSGVTKAFDSLGKSSEKAFSIKNLRQALKLLIKYVFGVRSFFFLYRKLRAGVGEGLKNLVQFNDGANDTNYAITELRTSLLYLKNAWAAAFAPIINTVYPILVKLMDLLASVGNAIARFIAALTGQATVLQAVKVSAGDYADSLKEAGGSAGKAAKNQEDLNDRLAEFDDLNVLGVDKDKTTPSGSGGGGGADDLTPNVQDMFEQINTPFNKLADMIKKAWESGNGFWLGKYIAESLSQSLDEAHDWLTGKGRDKMLKIANLIGTTLDGVLSVEDLGSKIGQVLADAFDFGLTFLDTIITPGRMFKIGVQIAEAMNTAIPQILPRLGESIGNLFVSAISGWYGWVTTADFKGFGEAIANAINNFINQMNQQLTKGTIKNPTGLNGWQMLGVNITEMAQGMINALAEAIADTDWQALGRGFAQLLSNIDFTGIWAGILNVGNSIGNGAKDIWGAFSDEAPGIAMWLEPLVTVIRQLPDLLNSIMGIVKQFMPNTKELRVWITQLPGKIDRLFEVIQNIADFIENTLIPILEDVFEVGGGVVEDVTDKIQRGREWATETTTGRATTRAARWGINGSLVGGILGYGLGGGPLSPLSPATAGLGAWVGGSIGALGGSTSSILSDLFGNKRNEGVRFDAGPITTGLKEINESLKDTEDVATRVKGAFNLDTIAESIKGTVTASTTSLGQIPEKFTEIKGAADSQSMGIKDKFVASFNSIKEESAIGSKTVEENFKLASDNIKTSFIDAWGEIKGSISEGGDLFVALSDGLGGTVKSLLNAMITGINLSITKPLQDISQSFNVLRALDVNGSKPFAGIPYLKVPTIPHLAQGAVIPPNREFMAVLGDQRSGTNIEAPLDTIKQAVADVMGSGNAEVVALLSQLIQVVQDKNLNIGDKEIGRANARYEARQKIIKGTML